MDWLFGKELNGFKKIGRNVLISRHTMIYGRENIEIGDNVRIDAFNIILASSGYLNIGMYVHLAARSTFLCSGGITLEDFAQVATGCTILSASDDFSGISLIGPMVPEQYRNVTKAKVTLKYGSVVGAHSVILPGTELGYGAALGAMSLGKGHLVGEVIHVGVPAKPIKMRASDWFWKANELVSKNILSDRRHNSDTDKVPSTD